jgi:hypothetical protein
MSVYSNLVIADGASSFWRLNEPSGTTAVDIVGGKNGTISGGVTLNQPGALSDGDPSMAFNGTTGKIQTVGNVTLLTPYTVECWFKKAVPGGDLALLTTYRAPLDTEDLVLFRVLGANGRADIYIDHRAGAPVSDDGAQGQRTVNDGQWHHAAFVMYGATAQIFIDGAADTMTGQLQAPIIGSTLHAVELASFAGGSFWNGSLDDVAIYPVALTAAQVAAHYQARLLSGSRRPLPAFVLAHRRFPS